ncbi:MAG: ATP-binding protein [Spirosomataceae bacterium]
MKRTILILFISLFAEIDLGQSRKLIDRLKQELNSGTGLGLSLAYDIVTKGHGGTMEVETKEGEETIFIIKLPI